MDGELIMQNKKTMLTPRGNRGKSGKRRVTGKHTAGERRKSKGRRREMSQERKGSRTGSCQKTDCDLVHRKST
jgi:hypothetical protein